MFNFIHKRFEYCQTNNGFALYDKVELCCSIKEGETACVINARGVPVRGVPAGGVRGRQFSEQQKRNLSFYTVRRKRQNKVVNSFSIITHLFTRNVYACYYHCMSIHSIFHICIRIIFLSKQAALLLRRSTYIFPLLLLTPGIQLCSVLNSHHFHVSVSLLS